MTWASATTSVATITTAGLATGVATGTSTISATLSGVTGSTVLTVSAAALQSIAVTPANPTIAKGTTQQFTATGTYSDSSTQNLTSQVTWASATTSVATITTAGLATGVATGTSTISATLSGVTGSTVLTVSAAALQSIALTPANPSITAGGTQQFTATGTYSDNSTQNLTSQVTWASATSAVATINSSGLATGVAQGISVISASLPGFTGTTLLTVNAATALQITNFNVQQGAIERSFIRTVDLSFNLSNGPSDLIASLSNPDPSKARVRLIGRGLDGSANVAIPIATKLKAIDKVLEFDFGPNGITGDSTSIVGDGYYEVQMDLDNNGTFETTKRFYRLLGDVNADQTVDDTDVIIITAALGNSGTNLDADVTGDGVVSAFDRTLARRARGRSLTGGLTLDG